MWFIDDGVFALPIEAISLKAIVTSSLFWVPFIFKDSKFSNVGSVALFTTTSKSFPFWVIDVEFLSDFSSSETCWYTCATVRPYFIAASLSTLIRCSTSILSKSLFISVTPLTDFSNFVISSDIDWSLSKLFPLILILIPLDNILPVSIADSLTVIS